MSFQLAALLIALLQEVHLFIIFSFSFSFFFFLFYLLLISLFEGGAIYFTLINSHPTLTDCIFYNNSATEFGWGNDIAFLSDVELGISSNIKYCCSTSLSPRIAGNDTSLIALLVDCPSDNNDYLRECKLNSSSNAPECLNLQHYEVMGGGCILKVCKSRIVIEFAEEGQQCGPGNCFKDNQDGSKCTESCFNPSHYYGNLASHQCDEKPCVERTSNSSDKNPCGSGECYFDIYSGNKCVFEKCVNEGLFRPVDGICVMKECEFRTPDSLSSSFPCGITDSNCTLDNGSCKTSCSIPDHYGIINGICTAKNCTDRKINGSKSFPCGDNCLFDSENLQCVTSCDSNYGTKNGICSPKSLNTFTAPLWLLIFLLVIIIVFFVIIVMFVGFCLRRKNWRNDCKEAFNYSAASEPDYVDLPENNLSVKRNLKIDKFEEDVKSFSSSSSKSVDSSSQSANAGGSEVDNFGHSLHSLSAGRI
jgi:hypothetical protein